MPPRRASTRILLSRRYFRSQSSTQQAPLTERFADVVSRLTQIYPEVSAETVETVVHHNHARFDGRPVRDFVPLFVERGATKELARLAVG